MNAINPALFGADDTMPQHRPRRLDGMRRPRRRLERRTREEAERRRHIQPLEQQSLLAKLGACEPAHDD